MNERPKPPALEPDEDFEADLAHDLAKERALIEQDDAANLESVWPDWGDL